MRIKVNNAIRGQLVKTDITATNASGFLMLFVKILLVRTKS